MRIQLKSDLHLEDIYGTTKPLVTAEVSPLYVDPTAEVLVLAGDIININEYQINCLIGDLKDVTIPILYVPGNHEYWHTSRQEGKELLKSMLEGTNITFFDRDYKVFKGEEEVLFIGATLWSPINTPMEALVAEGTPDIRKVKDVTVDSWNKTYINELDFIERTLAFPSFKHLKKVVITHHLPSFKSVPDRYKGDLGNCIFASHSDYLMMEEDTAPEVWMHGHTHDSKDYVNGNTRVVCNPRGHSGRDRNPKYNNALIIEV